MVRNGIKAGYKPFRVAVLATDQSAPTGYEAIHVDGTRGIALIRILIDDPARFPVIDTERRATTCHTA